MTHYRVELTLSQIDEYTDAQNYTRERSSTIAKLDLTAGSPGSAMAQILPHVKELTDWHADVKVLPSTSDSQEGAA